jgi:predicted RNA polymerase sigma factor
MKLGREAEAGEELQRAIFLTDNLREKQLLAEKLNQIENITELKG